MQANAYAMIQRRARAAGLRTRIGNHTFATGITAYLKNGGTPEKAAMIVPRPARPSLMTAAAMRSAWTRSSAS